MASDDRLYFRQLLSGRDFAAGDPIAEQMRNFAYLIGDRESSEAVIVDPAYAAGDLLDTLAEDGMTLSGVLVTHHHPDHIGGSMMGFELKGLAELLEQVSVPVHVNTHEAQWVSQITGIPMSDLTEHHHGDTVTVGAIDIELLHTPGHTPGSQCFLLDGRLVAGDTLFLDGCGRTDFPGGDVLDGALATGPGVAIADVDGDGWLDAWVATPVATLPPRKTRSPPPEGGPSGSVPGSKYGQLAS
jgi:glyoxylase-like metal-dependent hydrolase (beta-lactamase superfamily II)